MKKGSLFFALLLLLPSAAMAAIAIFTDGRTMKVDGYAASSGMIDLHLSVGGTITVPIDRIDRIIDDEVSVDEPEIAAVGSTIYPSRTWRFDENRRPRIRSRYDDIIVAAARRHDVDAVLVAAVIKAESNFQPGVVSHKGAQGLMQLMPATARRFGVSHPFDPASNIFGGTQYLRWLLDRFDGNVQLALAGYNAGEGNVAKYGGIPPFRETVNYVRKITGFLNDDFAALSTSVAAAR
jgi:hypothetical protein